MNRFSEARFIKSVYRAEDLGESVGEVAFVGRSNVGKSTAINSICGKKNLARMSQTPGSTRTINVYEVFKNKWIVDLPGYGYITGPKASWEKLEEMIKSYLLNRPSLRMVVLLVDGFVGATKLDVNTEFWLDSHRLPFMIVANKCDRIGAAKQKISRKNVAEKLGRLPENIWWVSAEKGLGMPALINEIAEILELPKDSKHR